MTDREKKDIVILKGLCKWATIPPNKARKPHPDYINPEEPNNCKYKIDVECSDEQFAQLKKAGLKSPAKLSIDEKSGVSYLTISAHKISRGDKVHDDLQVIDQYGDPITDKVGNGSRVVVKAELVKTKFGKFLYMRKVQVTDLIVFESAEDADDDIFEIKAKPKVELSDGADDSGDIGDFI